MVYRRSDEFTKQQVGAVPNRSVDRLLDARTRVQYDKAVRWRAKGTTQRCPRVRQPSRQGARSCRVGKRPSKAEMEPPRRHNRSLDAGQSRQLSRDREQRQMVVDDDHSGDAKVRIVTAQRPSALRNFTRDFNECRVNVGIVAIEV